MDLSCNKNIIRVLLFLFLLSGKSGIGSFAQTTLTGKVTDKDSGGEMIGANVVVTKNGNFVQRDITDIDGNFSIRVDPETYDVEVSWGTYSKYKIIKVEVLPYVANKVDVQIDKNKRERIVEYKQPVLTEKMQSRVDYNKRRFKVLSNIGNRNTFIRGKVTDKKTGEEMIGANIMVKKNEVFVQGETTDINGDFSIRVAPGTYDVKVSYTGYPSQLIEEVVVPVGVVTKVDVALNLVGVQLDEWICCGSHWVIPLIRQDETTIKKTLTNEQMKKLPARSIKNIITTTPGVSISQ